MSAPYQTVLWAATLLAPAGPALAQASSAASASKTSPPATAASAAPASGTSNPLTYRSAFDGYRPFSDQPTVSWREANDLVGCIGGWQAYAREGQGGAAAEGSSPASAPMSRAPGRPGSSPAPAKVTPSPAKPASGAGGHFGHHSP